MRTEMPTPTGEEERLRIRPQRVGPSGRLEIGVPTWQLPGICRVKLQDS